MMLLEDFDFHVFYYLRGENNKPVVTVCLAKEGDRYFRGVSICSPKEEPDKETGRAWAMRRVLRAYRIFRKNTKVNSGPPIFKDRINFQSNNMIDFLNKYQSDTPFDHKTYIISYQDLTDFEKKIVSNKIKNEVN